MNEIQKKADHVFCIIQQLRIQPTYENTQIMMDCLETLKEIYNCAEKEESDKCEP